MNDSHQHSIPNVTSIHMKLIGLAGSRESVRNIILMPLAAARNALPPLPLRPLSHVSMDSFDSMRGLMSSKRAGAWPGGPAQAPRHVGDGI